MDVEPVSPAIAQAGRTERSPYRRRLLERVAPAPALAQGSGTILLVVVGYGQIVDCLDVGRLTQLLDGRDESLCARVEQVLGLTAVCFPAPQLRLLVLFLGESS